MHSMSSHQALLAVIVQRLADSDGAAPPILDVPVAVPSASDDGNAEDTEQRRAEIARFLREFHAHKSRLSDPMSTILRSVGGRLTYQFRGRQQAEPVDVIAIPKRDVVFYISPAGRVATTGPQAAEFVASLSPSFL
jgi:hypothetical protein